MASCDRRPRRRVARRPVAGALAVLVTLVAVAAPAVRAWAQEGPADRTTVDRQVREVMARPEFDYAPSLPERIVRWIGDRLDDLLPDGGGGGGTFGGGVGALFVWIVIAAAVAGVVAVLVVVLRHRMPRPDAELVAGEAEIEHRRTAADWRGDADRLESEGRWKEALRARYRELVRTLVDRRQLPDVPGRTTGELRADLHRTTPAADDAFDTCTLLFELAWYADVPTGPDEQQRFRAAATVVLDAPADDRFDRSLLLDPAAVLAGPTRGDR